MLLFRMSTRPLAWVLALALGACSSPVRVPDTAPTVRGTVASVRHSATASAVLVEPDEGACGMQATMDATTRILVEDPDGTIVAEGPPGAIPLGEGDAVTVWADGPVRESCPTQGRAAVIVVQTDSLDRSLLARHWVHAQEEDRDGVEVYRPEGSRDFPPRMFRAQYVLFPDGRAEVLVPHPADAHYFASGTWSLSASRPFALVIDYGGGADTLRVVELRPDLLRLRRSDS